MQEIKKEKKLWFKTDRAGSEVRDVLPHKMWFKNKVYGWGWTPCSWEGWAVLFAYFVALVGIFVNVDYNSHSGSDTVIGVAPHFIFLTLCLIFICYLTGEKPRWRWGK